MGSRDDQTKPHQPLLSSLVVRPADSAAGGAADYEPGEVRPDLPPHSRSDRFSDDHHGSFDRFPTFHPQFQQLIFFLLSSVAQFRRSMKFGSCSSFNLTIDR